MTGPSQPMAILDRTLQILTEGELRLRGFLANASNHTLLCQVGPAEDGMHAVYKPSSGEQPLWDFPTGTLCRREVAAYVVSRALGWDLVPATVLRDGPLGPGSVQLFIAHDPRLHYFVLVQDERFHPELARMALFDLLTNNTDRKGSHVLLDQDADRLYGIDHGVTFHPQPKLRTVIWELGGSPLQGEWRRDLKRLAEQLVREDDPLVQELCSLLSPREVAVTATRARALSRTRALPDVEEEQRPYPWPPL